MEADWDYQKRDLQIDTFENQRLYCQERYGMVWGIGFSAIRGAVWDQGWESYTTSGMVWDVPGYPTNIPYLWISH
jgi:hypothetical protein